jgi:hypothetical protein
MVAGGSRQNFRFGVGGVRHLEAGGLANPARGRNYQCEELGGALAKHFCDFQPSFALFGGALEKHFRTCSSQSAFYGGALEKHFRDFQLSFALYGGALAIFFRNPTGFPSNGAAFGRQSGCCHNGVMLPLS